MSNCPIDLHFSKTHSNKRIEKAYEGLGVKIVTRIIGLSPPDYFPAISFHRFMGCRTSKPITQTEWHSISIPKNRLELIVKAV